MAYAFVQQNANDLAATATTITVTLTPSAGNLLVFCVSGDALDTTSIALSDNLGVHNTFTQIATDLVSVADQRCAWWFAENCKGGATTFSATFSATTRFRTIYVAEYSGIATSGSFLNGARAENNGPGTGTDATSSGNANATSQPALAWGFSINVNGNSAPNAGTGFTSRTSVWSSATATGRPEDKRVTATGNVAATFTATTGTDPHANGVGIFLEAAGPAVFDDDSAPVATRMPWFVPWAPIRVGADEDFPAAIASAPNEDAPIVAVPRALAWAMPWPTSDEDLPIAAAAVVDDSTGASTQIAASTLSPPRPAAAEESPALTPAPPPATIFPLRVSGSGRYLEQADGTPFPVCADTTWSLFVDLPLSGVAAYFATLVAQGFNALMGNAIEHHYTVVKPPKNESGALPFTQRMDAATYTGSPNGTGGAAGTQGQFASDNYGSPSSQSPDCTFINNTYWTHVETILDAALANNLLVFVWPGYLGFHAGDEGWMGEMVVWDAAIGAGGFTGQSFADPSKSKLWNYGAWLAARWKNYPNIVWTMGGDYGTNTQTLSTPQRAAVVSLVAGMKSVSGQQSLLWTAHWDRPCISDDNLIAGVTWDINFGYSGDDVAEVVRRAYSTAAKPAVQGEDNYEAGSFGGVAPFRQYLWCGFLGGCAGGFYGHEQLWRFDDGSPGTDYTTLLATQARLDAVRQFALWKSLPWHRLRPNGLGGMGTIITAGGGTASPQSTTYVAAAATAAGDLLLAYVPPAHTGTITVDMTKMVASCRARWFDPSDGSFTAIGTFANTGTHAFTTPATNSAGDTDFLLLLDIDGAELDEDVSRWPSATFVPATPNRAGIEDEITATISVDDDQGRVSVPFAGWAAVRAGGGDDEALASIVDEDAGPAPALSCERSLVRSTPADDELPIAAIVDEDASSSTAPSAVDRWIVRGALDDDGVPTAAVATIVDDDGGQPPAVAASAWSPGRAPSADDELPIAVIASIVDDSVGPPLPCVLAPGIVCQRAAEDEIAIAAIVASIVDDDTSAPSVLANERPTSRGGPSDEEIPTAPIASIVDDDTTQSAPSLPGCSALRGALADDEVPTATSALDDFDAQPSVSVAAPSQAARASVEDDLPSQVVEDASWTFAIAWSPALLLVGAGVEEFPGTAPAPLIFGLDDDQPGAAWPLPWTSSLPVFAPSLDELAFAAIPTPPRFLTIHVQILNSAGPVVIVGDALAALPR